MEVVLPLKIFDAQDALELVRGKQFRNHKAYLSHRKKNMEEANDTGGVIIQVSL